MFSTGSVIVLSMVARTFMFLSSSLNPVIYIWGMVDIRMGSAKPAEQALVLLKHRVTVPLKGKTIRLMLSRH